MDKRSSLFFRNFNSDEEKKFYKMGSEGRFRIPWPIQNLEELAEDKIRIQQYKTFLESFYTIFFVSYTVL
jgi:hypothetical protein